MRGNPWNHGIVGKRPVRRRIFLRDVLICSLGAYGGPDAHMGVFADQMSRKTKRKE